jgi:putative ABC transport system permease protein
MVIGVMALVGAVETRLSALIPVGSMIIASAMNTTALALERFRAEVHAHVGQIDAALALGATPSRVSRPYVQAAVMASLIPRIDSLRSLGIVWIPGLMAGMILSGEDPIYAAIYQFVVIAMLFAAAGFSALSGILLIQSRVFSAAMQLTLRPETSSAESDP